ncbi:MAG: exodeoxyribonuclease VII large subunit [Firmicutes bacterium]|nr:exodeoxyribonuclease VII large subunit [Bacillota bacterium]
MEILSVSQVNKYIKNMMDCDTLLSDITVTGEISNFKRHSSGHYYFSVKDSGAAISAAMFKWQNRNLKFMPENGMRVLVHGKISVYEPSGQYQIIADSIEPDGIGALYAAYEKLRQRLESAGYFDRSRKKPLPQFPRRVGVITSPTGAAIRDILNILGRRFPLAEVVVCPSSVQGEAAPAELAAAVDAMNRARACDVIIIGRGGGSIEDLWAFNSIDVVMAVAESDIPVISAVGHETDFTLCDFVADMRAPTPSAAAELAVPDSAAVMNYLRQFSAKSKSSLDRIIKSGENRVAAVMQMHCMKNPMNVIETKARMLDDVWTSINAGQSEILGSCEMRLRENASRLAALNPMAILGRGYSVVYKGGAPINSADSLTEGDTVEVQLSDGKAECIVRSVEKISMKGYDM